MEKKLEKKCKVDDFQVGSKYRWFLQTFCVTKIDYQYGYVLIIWNKDNIKGLIQLNTEFYAYEVPLSSLEKELM